MKDWELKGKPALLILHMQQGLLFQGSDRLNIVIKSGIIAKQQALLKAFRDKKLPVIFVSAIRRPPVTVNLPVYGHIYEEIDSISLDDSEVKVIPELAPIPGEPLLIDWPVTGFNNSGLEIVLKQYQAETLVLAGFTTNVAVYGTALGAVDRFFNVIIPSDASTTASAEAHKAVMEIMAPRLALVTTTDDVIKHLSSVSSSLRG
jgi:nicotinamidase-related amidase